MLRLCTCLPVAASRALVTRLTIRQALPGRSSPLLDISILGASATDISGELFDGESSFQRHGYCRIRRLRNRMDQAVVDRAG